MTRILAIRDGKLVVTDGTVVVATIATVDDFNAAVLANGGELLASSSVDFPHEYTDDPAVIALAAAIRG